MDELSLMVEAGNNLADRLDVSAGIAGQGQAAPTVNAVETIDQENARLAEISETRSGAISGLGGAKLGAGDETEARELENQLLETLKRAR